MKEARIIFPVEGQLNPVLSCIDNLVRAFGGATVYAAQGHWTHPNGMVLSEACRIADIAMEVSRLNDEKLYDIAWKFREAAGQIEVYVRYANGNVQMVTEKSCMDNGEKEPFDWDTMRAELHRALDDPMDIIEVPEHVAVSV